MADKASQNPPQRDERALAHKPLGLLSSEFTVYPTSSASMPPVTIGIARGPFNFQEYLRPDEAKELGAALIEQAFQVERKANAEASPVSRAREPIFDQQSLRRKADYPAVVKAEAAVRDLNVNDSITTYGDIRCLAGTDGEAPVLPAGSYFVDWPADPNGVVGLRESDAGQAGGFDVSVHVLAAVPFDVQRAPDNEPF